MSDQDARFTRALDAYATATSGDALDSQQLRRRVLGEMRAPRRRAARKVWFVLPLAATFVASAALAASQPAVRAAIQQGVQALLGVATQDRPSNVPRPRAAPPAATALPSAIATPLSPEPRPLSPNDLPTLREAPRAAAPSARPRGSAPKPNVELALDPEVESYRQVHRTHFGGATPAAALAAWDSYLAEYPGGSFAPDARFNRALCLVRLGRRSEARAALAPFAGAPIGSYRQAEAASLLLSFDSAH